MALGYVILSHRGNAITMQIRRKTNMKANYYKMLDLLLQRYWKTLME